MKKMIIGTLLLIAGTAISQTTQQKMAEAKNKSQTTTQTTTSPVKPKTRSIDAANPNYAKEQKKYTGPDRDFAPRKTKPGTRKDEAKAKQ